MFDTFLSWPMPLIWMMGLGIIVWWWCRSGTLLAVAASLLLASSMPLVGKLLHLPLKAGVVQSVEQLSTLKVSAVFVPTAGSFRDALGRWWPEEGSFRRFAAALKLAKRLDVPVIVGGGSPLKKQPSEAHTIVDVAQQAGVDIVVVGQGRNSAETAKAVGRLAYAKNDGVVLVTDGIHISRMRAALRSYGTVVRASTTPRWLQDKPRAVRWSWHDFVPSDDGLDLTSAAVYEYVGLVWYLVSGKIGMRDL